jgi:hypothetical protein
MTKAARRIAKIVQPKPKIIPVRKPSGTLRIAPVETFKIARPAAVVARPAVKKAAAKPTIVSPVKLATWLVPRPSARTSAAQVKVPRKLQPVEKPKTTIMTVPRPARSQAGPAAKAFNNKTLEKAKGSVSDRLRELSGRSYDVYEDRFLTKARSSIRKVLGAGKGLFFNLPEEAEDMVYNFLRDHYSDPYMDWENSADRKNLLTMGFDLPVLQPIIDECYRTL